ncbi:MAG: hypothetical protein ACE15C_01215 [Phycisphaerae bacterium]
MRRWRLLVPSLVGLAAFLAESSPAMAGGGPENVLVVVNPESWASLTVANHFIRARHIPDCDVVFLPFKLDRRDDATDVEAFRERLLKPVLAAVKDRGLEKQIDCIAWSSDFPTAIDFSADMGGSRGGAIASINGLTFLYEQVLAKEGRAYSALNANHYYRLQRTAGTDEAGKPRFDVQPPVAFSSQIAWGADGKPVAAPADAATRPADSGRKYMLSIVLGVTSGRGNSVMEVADCLKRAAAADGTCPKGTFYYMADGAIRTQTREAWFKPAVAALEKLGMAAAIIRDYGTPKDKDHCVAMPKGKDDIIGAMLGQQYPCPPRSGSKTLPGAIVENLTSEGGIMSWSGGQVPISDFIRFGAAGSSGTVTEPMAIWQKFPHPFIFYHYAAGCSLAEAFYLSVQGPYQLLIVGDPLCQPFAKPPRIQTVEYDKGTLKPTLAGDSPKAKKCWVYVDGVLEECPGAEPLLPDRTLKGGYHEAVFVATGDDAIRAQGRKPLDWLPQVYQPKPVRITGHKTVVFGKPIMLSVETQKANKFELLHSGRVLATADGAKVKFEIDSRRLGMGTARLQAVADDNGQEIASAPYEVEVVADRPLPAVDVKVPDGQALLDGPTLVYKADGKDSAPRIVEDMRRKAALQEAKVPAGAEYRIEAYFDAAADDLYQFQVWTDGKAAVKVDGVEIGATAPPAPPDKAGWTFLPVALAKGKHLMTVTGTAGAARELTIRFGGPGTRDIGKRCNNWEMQTEHPAYHFAHIGPKPPATATAGTKD